MYALRVTFVVSMFTVWYCAAMERREEIVFADVETSSYPVLREVTGPVLDSLPHDGSTQATIKALLRRGRATASEPRIMTRGLIANQMADVAGSAAQSAAHTFQQDLNGRLAALEEGLLHIGGNTDQQDASVNQLKATVIKAIVGLLGVGATAVGLVAAQAVQAAMCKPA